MEISLLKLIHSLIIVLRWGKNPWIFRLARSQIHQMITHWDQVYTLAAVVLVSFQLKMLNKRRSLMTWPRVGKRSKLEDLGNSYGPSKCYSSINNSFSYRTDISWAHSTVSLGMAVTETSPSEMISRVSVIKAHPPHLISSLVIYHTCPIQALRQVATFHRMLLPLFISLQFNNKKSILSRGRNFISLRKMQAGGLKQVAPPVTCSQSSPLWRVEDSCLLVALFFKRILTFKAFRVVRELVPARWISIFRTSQQIKVRILSPFK